MLEVRASSGGTNTYLNLQTSPVYAQNGNGENVLVRTERYLEWGTNQDNTNAPARTYADMKRLWVKKARQDDSNWRNCTNGTNWNAGISGNVLRVSYAGGRVHLAGQLTDRHRLFCRCSTSSGCRHTGEGHGGQVYLQSSGCAQ